MLRSDSTFANSNPADTRTE